MSTLHIPDAAVASMDDRIPEMVELLMRGNSMKAVAEHFGVAERTVYRWKTTGLGQQLIAQAKRESIDRAHRAVSSASTRAAATLVEIATDKKARRSDRVRAAEVILRASGVSEMGALLMDEEGQDAKVVAELSLMVKFEALEASLRRMGPQVEPGVLVVVNQ